MRLTYPIPTRDLSSIAKTNPVFSYPAVGISKTVGHFIFKTPQLRRKIAQLSSESPLVLQESARENLHTTDFLSFFAKINTEETAVSKKYAYLSISICFVRQIVRRTSSPHLLHLEEQACEHSPLPPPRCTHSCRRSHTRPHPRSPNAPSPSQL